MLKFPKDIRSWNDFLFQIKHRNLSICYALKSFKVSLPDSPHPGELFQPPPKDAKLGKILRPRVPHPLCQLGSGVDQSQTWKTERKIVFAQDIQTIATQTERNENVASEGKDSNSMGHTRPLFHLFLVTIQIQIEKCVLLCSGLEPSAAGWQAHADPLNYCSLLV